MTGRNGSDTYTIGANLATYLGSIFIDGSAGQVTCHRSYGQSRKWGVWNAYNRQPLYLKAGDATASWSYATNTVRASNNNSANSLTVFQGLSEEAYDLEFTQYMRVGGEDARNRNGIGWNSTTVMSGRNGEVGSHRSGGTTAVSIDGNAYAEFLQVPSLGINVVTALEIATQAGSNTWFGGEDDMVLSANWRG